MPTTEPAFSVTLRTGPTGPILEAAGELDLDGAPHLHTALRRALTTSPASPILVIDLAAVTFCDSCGLNALLRARIEAERRGAAVRLARPSRTLVRLLQITGADRVFPVDHDVPAEAPPGTARLPPATGPAFAGDRGGG
ncbi:STAS domain-containing protein [Kitasatospora sp. NBC_00315]|uniref:STAS domain-containing protein n=1 Tax=Kitasatospora sp. NBC_00315 TaxID=2975963 RepID=UPI0032513C77